jgi:hypothetical protein
MGDWREAADRALSLLTDDTSDEGSRTKRMVSHILEDENRDDYISKDFFNVQQTAGGLPDGMSFERFVDLIAGHMRDDLAMSSFAPEVSDGDFRTALLSIDENIRRHIRFLNGIVHQIAPGEVHLALWQLILDARSDDRSLYSCYRDFLVDA